MNWLDSARVSGALQGVGHEQVSNEQDADLVFVNSCTVTSEADRKSRQISKAAEKTAREVAIMGCGPRVDFNHWSNSLPEALIFKNEAEIFRHFDVTDDKDIFPLNTRTRLPVAIQQGCDNQCTFCITRIARGKHINIPLNTIIDQIKLAEDHGVKEVVLTGINLAAWGCTDSNKAEQSRLSELLENILGKTEMPRIRISSAGPQYLNSDFFDVFAEERICDHLHLSIQSGSPDIVDRMIRGHGIEEVYFIAERARQARPDVALTCDLIAGFPGETTRHFQESVELVETVRFAKLHVFPYSVREGTPAECFTEQVAMAERKERAAQLRALGMQHRKAFLLSQQAKEREILVESNGFGLTANYIRVKAPDMAREGDILPVRLGPDTISERGL